MPIRGCLQLCRKSESLVGTNVIGHWVAANGRSTFKYTISGIILGLGSANERRCYHVLPSLIGQEHTQNGPCIWSILHDLPKMKSGQIKCYNCVIVMTC